jgi:hypothetical protein
MLLEIFSFVKEIFSPAAKLIDDIHTSDEEKSSLRNELAKIEQAITLKTIEYESKLLDVKSQIIMAETQSDSWLAKNWRPLMMMAFGSIVIMYWFGYQPANLSEARLADIFQLIKIGLGGYVVGRSGEKIAKVMKK